MTSSRPPDDDYVLRLAVPRDKIAMAEHWRSTWVLSSIQTLKERGHFARYESMLPREHADAILLSVAGVWLPVKVARAHYETCDALGLSKEEVLDIGRSSGERAQGTVLQTAVKMATGAGVTPWKIIPQLQRLWERGADGGGVCAWKIGPKEAGIEVVGCALFDVPYFRGAFVGVVEGIVKMFCRRVWMHDETPARSRGMIALRAQWV